MRSSHGSRWMLGLAVIACVCGLDQGEANRASARGAGEGTPGADALRALPPDTGCVPACTDKQCGPDGCGDSCGSCPPYDSCSAAGLCFCNPDCNGLQCGPDGCGGSCGTCPAGNTCDPNTGQCGLCQSGEKRCATNDVLALEVCRNGKWESTRCPDYTMCSDSKCRSLCDGWIAAHGRSAFCLAPHPDSGRIYLISNDSAHWNNNTIAVRVNSENNTPAPILLDRSLNWPGVFRLNCPQGTAALFYSLTFFPQWIAPSQVTFIMGLKRAGQSAQGSIWRVDFRNVNASIGYAQQAVPGTYQGISIILSSPLTGNLDTWGNSNMVYLTLSASLPWAGCDSVDLNWLYLEVRY